MAGYDCGETHGLIWFYTFLFFASSLLSKSKFTLTISFHFILWTVWFTVFNFSHDIYHTFIIFRIFFICRVSNKWTNLKQYFVTFMLIFDEFIFLLLIFLKMYRNQAHIPFESLVVNYIIYFTKIHFSHFNGRQY